MEGLVVVIYLAFCFYLAQDHMKRAPNETRITRVGLLVELANHYTTRGLVVCPRGVMVKAVDCGIVVSKFLFKSRYYVLI